MLWVGSCVGGAEDESEHYAAKATKRERWTKATESEKKGVGEEGWEESKEGWKTGGGQAESEDELRGEGGDDVVG